MSLLRMVKPSHRSTGSRVFQVVNIFLLSLLALLCILPFLHILAVSLSDAASVSANRVGLWPQGFNLNAYRKIFQNHYLLDSFWVTIKRMVLGTAFSMILTVLTAYPLSFSSREFPGRRIYVVFYFISMMFSGGIIPQYMLISNLHLMDTIWALVLGGVPVFNVIVLLNFFRQLPRPLYESARMDGASHLRILMEIYLPLSLPSLATLGLLSLVGHWNDWFGGLVYMKSMENYPLQTYLYNTMQNFSEYYPAFGQDATAAPRQATIAAQTVISILPVLFAFPVLSKYIKTGLVLGSVKE